MSPMLATLEEVRSNVSLVASSASTDTTCQNSPELQERNYMVLSRCSSVESSVIPSPVDEKETKMNMKATELRLGLPGSQSPVRDQELSSTSSKHNEKPLFPVVPLRNNVVSGNKRGFSDAMDGFSEVKAPAFTNANWIFTAVRSESEADQSVAEGNFFPKTGAKIIPSSGPSPNSAVKPDSIKDQAGPSAVLLKEIVAPKVSQGKMSSVNDNGSAPASKALVVGWPPIRSFRKNTLANASKSPEEVDGNPGLGSLFVKVSMDGAPYLRKVDLKTYSTYLELSSALEKMFSFTVGQYESPGIRGRDMLSETKLKDLLHGSEYVLTYEDKDGDWMLVGDVPWEMFIDSCRRLRIVQGSDAIGLAPRATENCRNHN